MVILYILLVLIAVILARTLMFTPKKTEDRERPPVEQDRDASIRNLAELIKCKTVSYYDASLEDDAEFEKLVGKLPELYPNVCKTCTLQRFDGRGLLFRWQGRAQGEPAVLMAHYDVVPVEEENWSKPPFEAIIEDGVMWGRGTLDTKVTFNGILSAAEELIGRVRDADLILVEGYNNAGLQRIGVSRAATGKGFREDPSRCIALVTDEPVSGAAAPVFGLEDIGPLCDFILKYAGLSGQTEAGR